MGSTRALQLRRRQNPTRVRRSGTAYAEPRGTTQTTDRTTKRSCSSAMADASNGSTQRASENRKRRLSDKLSPQPATCVFCADLTKTVVSSCFRHACVCVVNESGVPALVEELKKSNADKLLKLKDEGSSSNDTPTS